MAAGRNSRPKLIPIEKARWRLALVWFLGCGFMFLMLVAMSIRDTFGDQTPRVWGWALPNFLPTLALMISVFAADALSPYNSKWASVRAPFFYLAVSMSAFYILLMLIQIFYWPIPDVPLRLERLEMSTMWLGPLQGLVVALLGTLFFLKEEAEGGNDSRLEEE